MQHAQQAMCSALADEAIRRLPKHEQDEMQEAVRKLKAMCAFVRAGLDGSESIAAPEQRAGK